MKPRKKPRKAGRPKSPENEVKGAVITIRMPTSEREEIAEAVDGKRGKLSEWARAVLLRAARMAKVPVSKPEDAGIEPHV